MAQVIIIFLAPLFAAAFFEIGGGYFIWQWLREKGGKIYGLFGAPMLFIYAIILTFQPANFGRVYAAYGGIMP